DRERGRRLIERRGCLRLDPERDGLDLRARTCVTEAPGMRIVKAAHPAAIRADGQLVALPAVACVPGAAHDNVSPGDVFIHQLGARFGRERIKGLIEREIRERTPSCEHCPGRLLAHRRHEHAERGEHTWRGRYEYTRDAQTLRQLAGMQAGSAAERDQREVGWLVAALHTDDAQRTFHRRVYDVDHALRRSIGTSPESFCE